MTKRIYKRTNPYSGESEVLTNDEALLYDMINYEQVSKSISDIVKPKNFTSELHIIYQKIENLNRACPNNLGDWYFTGNYPTYGGNKVANRAFMNYCNGIKKRAY